MKCGRVNAYECNCTEASRELTSDSLKPGIRHRLRNEAHYVR